MTSWLTEFSGVLMAPETLFSLKLTAKVTSLTLIFHAIAGLVFGYLLSRPRFMGQRFLELFVTLPLVFPPVATGFALLMLFGKQGIISSQYAWIDFDLIFSFKGVVLASFIAGLPLVVKPIQAAMTQVSQRWSEVARTLGKSEWEIILFVLIPNIRYALMTGLLLGLGRSLGEVGITLMLGGNISGRTNTISLEIYNAVFSGEFQRAGYLSFILGIISLFLFWLLQRMAKQNHGAPE